MVFKFNFDGIEVPEGSEISEAKLHLYNYGDINNFLNPPKKVFHIKEEWSEESVTFNTQPEIDWESGGPEFQGMPFDTWETIDMRDIARDLIYGDSINRGFAFGTFSYNYGGCRYHSSEYEVQELRPKLELLVSDNLSPVINLLTLNGDKDVEAGTEELVKWEASDDVAIKAVVIHYNIDNEWVLLDSVTDGSSELVWKIPIYDYRKRCFFRLTAYDNTDKISTDFSDSAFIIEKPTSIVTTTQNENSAFNLISQGSGLVLTMKSAIPATVTAFDVRGQKLQSFNTVPHQERYLLSDLGAEKLIIFRIRDEKGERVIRTMR